MARDHRAVLARRTARRVALGGAAGLAHEFAPEAAAASRKALWKVVAVGSGATAALGAHQLVKFVWTRATGTTDAPDPSDPDTPLSVAIGWTISIAVGVLVGRRVAARLAAKGWEVAFHEPPPGKASSSAADA